MYVNHVSKKPTAAHLAGRVSILRMKKSIGIIRVKRPCHLYIAETFSKGG